MTWWIARWHQHEFRLGKNSYGIILMKVKATYVTEHQFFIQCLEASGLTRISLHYLWTWRWKRKTTHKKMIRWRREFHHVDDENEGARLASRYQSSCLRNRIWQKKLFMNSISSLCHSDFTYIWRIKRQHDEFNPRYSIIWQTRGAKHTSNQTHGRK